MSPTSIDVRIEPRDGRRAHAGRRRARRPDAAVQGAAAQALLRRARLASCSTASASCPSTTRPAPSARSSTAARPRSSRAPAPRELVELGSGTAPKTRVLLDAMAERGHAAPLRPVRRRRVGGARERRRRWSTSYPGLEVHGVVGDFERHLDHVPAARRRPRLVALLGGTIGNFPPGSRAALAARVAALLGPERPPPARHRPGQGPGDASRPPTTTRRASPPSSTATCCTCSTASWTPTSTPTRSSTSRSSTAAASGSRCACARSARLHRSIAGARPARSSFADGEELRTEISAKFTPRAPGARPRRGGHGPRRRCSTDPDGLFGAVARPAVSNVAAPCRSKAAARSSPAGRRGSARRRYASCTSAAPW